MKNKSNPSKTGGTVVLFELLLKELTKKGIDFEVIDTLKDNYPNTLSAYFSISLQLIRKIRHYEYISLHATTNSLIAIGPVMILLAKIFKRKTSIRKFAGNLHEIYENTYFIKRYIINYVLKNSTINFFETKYLVKYFSQFNTHTYWFPNVRETTLSPVIPRKYKKKFVYIGTINEEKGIEQIIEVSTKLSDDITLDLYGPIIDKKYSDVMFKKKDINYKGQLESKDVIAVMNKYDILILPSYREGYPGVIIEAFSLGIPSISTKLDGIMEMIENKKNGILINVKNSKELEKEIINMNELKYTQLSKNAYISFNDYESKKQTNLFLQRVYSVC